MNSTDYTEQYHRLRASHPMWLAEARTLRRLAGPCGHGTVVDVGCGSGALLAMLEPEKGIGLDRSSRAIQIARLQYRQYDFRLGEAADLQLPPRSVNCVVSMHLIEHLDDPAAALRAWHEVLAPGGVLALCTPNAAFAHPEQFADPDHKHLFTGPELAGLVASVGFRVQRVFTIGAWGVRHWPFFWRFQPLFTPMRWPRLPGLRWRGQSLCLSASRGGSL